MLAGPGDCRYGSGMLDDIRALLLLQDRDRRIATMEKDLAKLPNDEVRAKHKLASDENAVAAAHQAVIDAELELKRLELDAGTRKTTIQRLKTQQFETRKNEEYQALGHEVQRYEAEIDALETKELELMERIDALRATHQQAQQAKAKTQQLVDEDLAQLVTRRERISTDLEELKAERARLREAAPQDLLPLYDRLLKTKDGIAVAPAEDSKCGGCHMKVIAQTIHAVKSGHEITHCEMCGRMLYFVE